MLKKTLFYLLDFHLISCTVFNTASCVAPQISLFGGFWEYQISLISEGIHLNNAHTHIIHSNLGEGHQTRDVLCALAVSAGGGNRLQKLAGEELCAGRKKPREERKCRIQECREAWFTTTWGQVRMEKIAYILYFYYVLSMHISNT